MGIYKKIEDLKKIREACRLSKMVLEKVGTEVRNGITTKELEFVAENLIKEYNINSAFKGYRGYPGLICVSVNEEVVHGIPLEKKIIRDGDIVSIDVGIRYQGFCGDCAGTFPVGEIIQEKRRLVDVTKSLCLQEYQWLIKATISAT